MPIIVSTHPRTRQRLEDIGMQVPDSRIRFLRPFGFLDYVKLQMDSFCILSDSGTIAEESSLLNLRAVTTRDAHERPEGMDDGALIMSSLRVERVLDAVRVVTHQHSVSERRFRTVPDYEGGLVSVKVLRTVLSYLDYVNRVVWSK
jgi:UDP-N-acetylglucosamine 2-epimerase (non-hydrolysing)